MKIWDTILDLLDPTFILWDTHSIISDTIMNKWDISFLSNKFNKKNPLRINVTGNNSNYMLSKYTLFELF